MEIRTIASVVIGWSIGTVLGNLLIKLANWSKK